MCVECTTIRHSSKHAEIPLSSKHLKKVMHRLVKSVEKAVGDEMKKAPIEAIVHDGWSKVSTHCFGLCACCSLKVGSLHKSQIALLAVSPIQQKPELETHDDDSTTSDQTPLTKTVWFNADTHVSFIKNAFKCCNQVVCCTNMQPCLSQLLHCNKALHQTHWLQESSTCLGCKGRDQKQCHHCCCAGLCA